MLKSTICTIKFTKSFPENSFLCEREKNSMLVEAFAELQEKYNFKVIFVKIQKTPLACIFKFKCKKEDKLKICKDFCLILGEKVDKVSFR